MRANLMVLAMIAAGVLVGCQQSGRPRPAPAAVPTPPAFGQVVDGAYVVAPGDTVAVVAKRTNTPIRALIDANGLQPPYRLRGGQRLALQPRREYVVRSGDTVDLVAQHEGVSPSALIQLNALTAPYDLEVGRRLILPSETDVPRVSPRPEPAPSTAGEVSTGPLVSLPDSGATVSTEPAPLTPSPAEAAPAEPSQSEVLVPAPEGVAVAANPLPPLSGAPQPIEPAPGDAQQGALPEPVVPVPEITASPSAPVEIEGVQPPEAAPGSGFIWPVEGKIVSRFGTTADGLRNDGVNIAAPEGAPVKAAADGIVAYAGNELRGFGNMILIKHADNWVTAYAHNSGLLVKKGDEVKRGQTIARVGSTGNVANPQLHFEIRNGTKAVDPVTKLGG